MNERLNSNMNGNRTDENETAMNKLFRQQPRDSPSKMAASDMMVLINGPELTPPPRDLATPPRLVPRVPAEVPARLPAEIPTRLPAKIPARLSAIWLRGDAWAVLLALPCPRVWWTA